MNNKSEQSINSSTCKYPAKMSYEAVPANLEIAPNPQLETNVDNPHTDNSIKQLWNNTKIKVIAAFFVLAFVASFIIVIALIIKGADPAKIMDDVFGDKQQRIRGTLSFKCDAIAVTICPLGSNASSCFTDNVCHADTIDGHWVIENDYGKGQHFVKLDGNNITILNDFEGKFKIEVSMYRLVQDKYGFVFHLNGIPYATCLFQRLKEIFSKQTRFCDWKLAQSGQYRLDSVSNFILSTVMFNKTSTNLNKGGVIAISFSNNAFIVGTPSVYYDGTISR